MNAKVAPRRLARRPGRQPGLVAGVGLGLVVLAATIAVGGLRLRQHIRSQIAQRDGETLAAVAAMQYLDDKTSDETVSTLDDPGEQLQLALKISRLRNVLGVRLFSPAGTFVNALPVYITEATLAPEDLASLRALKPVSHFLPRARLEEHDLLAGTNGASVALLEVNIPLHEEGQQRLAGVAQFLMNGTSIAQEYADLDRRVALQSALVFLFGGSILAGGLALAFRRLQRANRLLGERTANLLKANSELALAAKTSAVGAVASHLIHGLKNPLSGLHHFVQDRAANQGNEHDTDWQLAVASTRRMESLISRVVQVLQAQECGAEYELSLAELADLLGAKLQATARAVGVQFETTMTGECVLANRQADLVLLILENLLQNALEATPAGKTVRLALVCEPHRLRVDVQDEGPGLPADLAARLFTPCVSAKKGGSGIGLAISGQLAKHLGAELELKESSPQGCVFCLSLPLQAQPAPRPAKQPFSPEPACTTP
jgi:signal transduction histidine kinase